MCGVTNNEICDVPKFEDLSSIMANVDVTLRALFVKVPLKLWGTLLQNSSFRCVHGKLFTPVSSNKANSHLLLACDFKG